MTAIKSHIVIINGNKGSGCKTLALELALALIYSSEKTAILLSDTSLLHQTLAKRKRLFPALPCPEIITRSSFFHKANNYDAIIIPEIPPKDELAVFASTFISIMEKRSSLNPDFKKNAPYLNALWELKKKIAAAQNHGLNWVVCENNPKNKNKNTSFEELQQTSRLYGFRIAPELHCRTAYKNLSQGLSAQDKFTPNLSKDLTYEDICAKREIIRLAEFIFNS